MTLPNELHPLQLAASSGGYEIEQSLRFDGSSRLTRTHSCSQTRTFSFWNKYAFDNVNRYLYFHGDGSYYLGTRSGGSPSFNSWQTLNQGSSFTNIYRDGVKFRDTAAWYHFVFKCTSSDVILYINGEQWGNAGGANIALSSKLFEIGSRGNAEFFSGYQAEWHFVDNQALDPTSFGEYDNNGVWRPIAYSGSYGTNGFYLKFDPSATNGIGHDHSGNGNNFTATGFDTTNTGAATYDVMSDTPTNNFATVSPLNINVQNVLSDGNLTINLNSSVAYKPTSTIAIPSSGKFYFEGTIQGGNSQTAPDRAHYFGLNESFPSSQFAAKLIGWFSQGTPQIYTGSGSSSAASGSGFVNGDVLQCAVDATTGKVWMGRNNTWYSTAANSNGDPAGGTNESATLVAGTQYHSFTSLGLDSGVTGGYYINFGQRPFAYTPPSGFKTLSTANLQTPSIKDGSKNFNTVLYTGTQGTLSVTGVGFQPDFVWIKNRGSAVKHMLFDSIRNVRRSLSSSNTDQEAYESSAGYLSAFDTDGFTVVEGTSAGVNWNNDTFVSWNWLANGNGSNIAAGSIDGTNPTIASTVSANPSAGFSIVTWTAPSSSQTNSVGHGLGVAPSFVICKSRSGGAGGLNWSSYHVSLGKDKYINLESAGTAQTVSNYWGANGMTSTTIGLPTGSSSTGYNNNTGNMVAYCFAEVEGYSKFGIYERNGSSDGPYIHLGFTPALILIKEYAAGTEGWALYDNKRLGYNPNDYPLFPNTTQTESYIASTYPNEIDFLSNGFKIRTSDSRYNSSLSSYRYLYAAWAVNPFGGDGVSPATAR
jgi:hypothetical protein